MSFSLQRNSLYLSFYSLPSIDALDLKHHSVLQCSWFLNMLPRGNLLAFCNHNILFILFFIIYPQSFLIWRESTLVNPHLCAFPSLTMTKTCLETTSTQWEESTRKDGTDVSLSRLHFDGLINCPRAPLDGFLSTAHIVLPCSLTMISLIK